MNKNKGIFMQSTNILVFIFIFLINIITYAQINNAPNAVYDVATVDQDTTLNAPSGAPDNYANLLDNDSDNDGDTLSITRFTVDGGVTWTNVGGTINMAEGSITINANGTYTFIPTPGYTGFVPNIIYEITDGEDTAMATLFLTVETSGDLMEISGISSCNQGYTANGEYKIRYQLSITNRSITRGYHQNSEITNIQLFDDLNAVFGDCITLIERELPTVNSPDDFLGGTYAVPNISFDAAEFDASDATPGADGIINNFTDVLYPKQTITLRFCLYIDPFCNGRPNPTPSGSGIDFNNIVNVTSNKGNDTAQLLLEDFHTPETTVAANLFIPDRSPLVNFDGTYDYVNTVIITNDGASQANNVNFNMGLKRFTDNGIVFSLGDHDNDTTTPDVQTPIVWQVDATGNPLSTVTVNSSYDGFNSTTLLDPNQILAAGETIYLKVFHHINSIISTDNNQFYNLNPSMTQGALDGSDETINDREKTNSFVLWDDVNGSHLDRYYEGNSISDIPSSNDQCICNFLDMQFEFGMQLNINKTLVDIEPAPSGILEHKLVSFNIRVGNESTSNVRVDNLNLIDNLLGICAGNILNVNGVTIQLPTATNEIPEEVPNLNLAYDGTTDTNLFDGASGILNPSEYLDVLITVLVSDDCFGTNNADFFGIDPLLNPTTSVSSGVSISVSSDTDNDGITNLNDIDDDNDGIPDTVEYNGLNPLDDADNDNIPNYRDTDFGVDINNDGIVDLFDFDMDGVPNHFDLDSDNDGIFDIVEAGNGTLDTSSNGQTNSAVGVNGLDDSLENTDDASAIINYTLPNSDTDTNLNYLDIDSDNDGIVDNIESQLTNSYNAPSLTVNNNGVDTNYLTGLTPIDTDTASIVPDGIPDYMDTDSDDDLRDDNIEAWDTDNNGVAEVNFSNGDADSDGLDNAYDNDDSQINPTNNQTPLDFPNVDNPVTPERDWREKPAIVVIIDNVTVVEGTDLVFTLSLVSLGDNTLLKTSTTDVVINIFTSDGTDTTTTFDIALAPFDYDEVPNTPTTITIPIGDSTIPVTIPTTNDTIDEIDEFMTLNVLTTSNNTVNPDTSLQEANISIEGIGTIQDNDNAPDLIMNDDIQLEGDDLVHKIEINPSVANPTTSSSRPIDIEIITTDLTAINPDDYTNTSPDTVTIAASDDPNNENTFVDYHIVTIFDDLNEPDNETVSVIGTVISGFVGTVDLDKVGTIIDRQPDPLVVISSPTVVEGNILEFVISLENPFTNEPLSNFEDTSLNIFTLDGTARELEDYLAISTQVTIPANTVSVIVQITTIDDILIEDLEDLTLKGIVTTFNTDNIEAEGIGIIIDNETPNLFSPNNDGLSDVFEIISLKQFLKFKLQIFDRWGSEVYNYENKGNPQPIWWDGTIEGNPVPEGVYYYTIDYNDGVTDSKSGFIQLIR